MDFCILCSLHLWTRNIPSRSRATISSFLNIVLGAFMSVQRCWLLLYVPGRHRREKDPFSLSGMFYICPREKTHIFSACFPASLETQVIIKIKFNVNFSKIFFLIRKWNENSMQPTGSNDLWSPQSKSYTEKKSCALGFGFCYEFCLVIFFFISFENKPASPI